MKASKLAQDNYSVEMTAAECDQIIVALEFARASKLGDLERWRLALDLDAAMLDRLTDRLFLASSRELTATW